MPSAIQGVLILIWGTVGVGRINGNNKTGLYKHVLKFQSFFLYKLLKFIKKKGNVFFQDLFFSINLS